MRRREILERLASGEIDIETAETLLAETALTELKGIAVVDVSREDRSGVPEVIMAGHKSTDDLIEIISAMVGRTGVALATRVNRTALSAIRSAFGEGHHIEVSGRNDHNTVLVHTTTWRPPLCDGRIAVMTAGTSDIPYAKEAEGIAKVMGVQVISFYDVGVAGLHRLIDPVRTIRREGVDAVVVFAGMEGALPTLVASLVDIPVVGVPVPVGYGYGGQGEIALGSMLQSCAPGLAVVNIGNGLGAGAFACLIARRCSARRGQQSGQTAPVRHE